MEPRPPRPRPATETGRWTEPSQTAPSPGAASPHVPPAPPAAGRHEPFPYPPSSGGTYPAVDDLSDQRRSGPGIPPGAAAGTHDRVGSEEPAANANRTPAIVGGVLALL